MKMRLQSRITARLGGALFGCSVLMFTGSLLACASTQVASQVNDPASPNAPTAAPHEASHALANGDGTSAETPPATTGHEHQTHATGSEPSAPTAAEHDHSGHASSPGGTHSADEGHGEEGAVYTCPMHPEVRSGQPGRCPKCGMNLERTKPEKSRE